MTLKIATWNMCLGLFYKKDYVRHLLHEHKIDILLLQETEITKEIDPLNLQIGGYILELETNDAKRRVGIYIRKNIAYKRRFDKEKENSHIIVLDVGSSAITRIINIYRTFKPQDLVTPREKFKTQLRTINAALTSSSLIIGDMNLNDEKKYLVDYSHRLLFQDLEEILGHHQMVQHVTEPTWERIVNGVLKHSTIDHIYSTENCSVQQLSYEKTIYGDHKLVMFQLVYKEKEIKLNLMRRSWRNYTKERLLRKLENVTWETGYDSVQDMWNDYEQSLMTIVSRTSR